MNPYQRVSPYQMPLPNKINTQSHSFMFHHEGSANRQPHSRALANHSGSNANWCRTMLTSSFSMLRKDYKPEDYRNDWLHFATAEGNVETVQDAISKGANIYKSVRDGETALHVAIYHQKKDIWKALLEVYEKDFSKVEEYLGRMWRWNRNDKFWLKKSIAVATSEEQCERAKELEHLSGVQELEKDKVELVLMKIAQENEFVAVIPVTDTNQLQVKGFVESLQSNGVLAWNYTGSNQKCDTFLQLAAFRGKVNLIRKLVQNGADLAHPGRDRRIPLMEACSTMCMKVIKLLLEEYHNQFDPTVIDCIGYTALTHILPKADTYDFDYLLQSMMSYRTSHFQETESEAFNRIFRYEHQNWPDMSIWSMTDEKSRGSFLVPYLERYGYDVSFQSGRRTMLMEMIIRHTAKDFYQSAIHRKPELLGLTDPEGCNVIHYLILCNELIFIKELYKLHVDQCRTLFECDGAIICLGSVMSDGYNEMLLFLLDKHLDFIATITDRMMDNFFNEDLLPPKLFDEPFDILIQHLPEVKSRFDELKIKIAEEEMLDIMAEYNF